MKIKSPIILLTLIVLISGLLMPYSVVHADGEDEFEVKVVAEENPDTGCFDVGVEVYNKGKDFTGTVEITRTSGSYYSDDGSSVYIQDAALPEKNTKTVSFQIPEELTNYNSGANMGINVVIKDSKGREVYNANFNNVLTKDNYVMNMGILSDSADKLTFLDCEGQDIWISTGVFAIKLNELKADSIANDLSANKYLIINDYDTSVLSDDAVKSIMSWVDNGGVLIIGTGKTVKTISGFDSTFTGINGSQGTGDGVLYSQRVADPFEFKVQYLDNDMNLTSDFYLGGYGNVGFSRMYGNGSVTTLNFDIADLKNQPKMDADEQTKNAEVTDMLSYIYDSTMANSNFVMDQSDIELDGNEVRSAAHYLEEPANTRVGYMVPLILAYIAIIGPILYIVLKKIGKREKCWIIIPGVALVFTFLLFLISLTFTVKGLKLKTLTLQKAGSDNMISVITGYSPKADVWTVGLDAKYYTGYNLVRWSYTGTNVSYKKTADGLGISYKPGSVFDEASFCAFGKTNRSGFFDVDISSGVAEIINNTGMDFDYIVACENGMAYLMKDCKNGEKVSVKDHVKTINSGRDFGTAAYSYYDNGDYEDAADYAMLQSCYNIVCDNGNAGLQANGTPIIIGIRKSENILQAKNGDEVSYTCVYMK